MGHIGQIKKEYRDLQKRLDRYPVGAPESDDLYEILRLVYTDKEARVASMMPMAPATAGKIARLSSADETETKSLLEGMADKGLVMDFTNQKTGKTFYMLAPTVVGFFEFTMMRERTDIPQKELAEALTRYMYDTGDYARAVFQEETQLGRTIVHETAVAESDISEVLDWERATAIVEAAGKYSQSLCYCRHKKRHMGEACGKPEDICMSLGGGAEWLISRNLGKEIPKSRALEILEIAREEGLVHIADNVQNEPSFICSCCGCCCGMLTAITKFDLKNAVHTSGFIAKIDEDVCKGCGKCAKRCPIGAINIKERAGEDGKKKKWAVVDKSICLGCGVCERACKFEALEMKKRTGKRIITPQNALDRILTMAIERDKLSEFLADEIPEIPGANFLKNLAGAALAMPAAKRTLLNRELKSRFIDFITRKAGV